MRTVMIICLSVFPLFVQAAGRKPKKSDIATLVTCASCMTGNTVELRLGKGERVRIDAEGSTGWGYMDDDITVESKGSRIAVFGPTVQGDRAVVFNQIQPDKKIVDLRYQELLKAGKDPKWLLLEDSGYRYVVPHAIWILDLDGNEYSKKVFDLYDEKLGGVKDPGSELLDDDGINHMRWLPKHGGVILDATVGGKTFLYIVKVFKERSVVRKLKWDADLDYLDHEPEWIDDEICQFHSKSGKDKKVDLRDFH